MRRPSNAPTNSRGAAGACDSPWCDAPATRRSSDAFLRNTGACDCDAPAQQRAGQPTRFCGNTGACDLPRCDAPAQRRAGQPTRFCGNTGACDLPRCDAPAQRRRSTDAFLRKHATCHGAMRRPSNAPVNGRGSADPLARAIRHGAMRPPAPRRSTDPFLRICGNTGACDCDAPAQRRAGQPTRFCGNTGVCDLPRCDAPAKPRRSTDPFLRKHATCHGAMRRPSNAAFKGRGSADPLARAIRHGAIRPPATRRSTDAFLRKRSACDSPWCDTPASDAPVNRRVSAETQRVRLATVRYARQRRAGQPTRFCGNAARATRHGAMPRQRRAGQPTRFCGNAGACHSPRCDAPSATRQSMAAGPRIPPPATRRSTDAFLRNAALR
jgi:hypothetical protein